MKYRLAVLACLYFVVSGAQAGWDPTMTPSWGANLEPEGKAPDAPAWEVSLPAFPKEENLVEFDVGAAVRFHVYVDTVSISVKGDEVRFAHVVRTPGGAVNVSYDGLRCSEYQRAIYASGRPDGTWSRARKSDWRLINESGAGGYFGTMTKELWCGEGGHGGPAGTPEQLVKALKAAPNLRR